MANGDAPLLLLTSEFGPAWGGVGTYCWNLVQAWPTDRPIVIVTSGSVEIPTDLPAQVSLVRLGPPLKGLYGYWRLQRLMGRWIQRELPGLGPAAVLSNFPPMPDLRVAKITPPWFTTIHTTVPGQHQATRAAGGRATADLVTALALPYIRRQERRYLASPRQPIFVSGYVREQVKSLYGVNAAEGPVIPNGVDTNTFFPAAEPPQDAPFLFVGRLVALKGLAMALQTLRLVVKDHPSASLVVAGPGDQHRWRAIAEGLGVGERVRFLGPVPYSRMPELYRSARALLVPSLTESSPFSVLEAMGSGCPVLANGVGGIPELLVDGQEGRLLKVDDLSGWAAAMGELMRDLDVAVEMAIRARARIEQEYTMGLMAERLAAEIGFSGGEHA